jgi:hypothetical protein
MPTFRKVEIVDARQFIGSVQQGTDLCLWVNSNNGRAHWHDKQLVGSRILSERIVLEIENGNDYTLVWLNDWIIRHQDGSWEAMRPEDLHEQYEEV